MNSARNNNDNSQVAIETDEEDESGSDETAVSPIKDKITTADKDAEAGEEGWRNKEGERLADFGVEEIADFYDEEDYLPLAEVMRRRKAGQ